MKTIFTLLFAFFFASSAFAYDEGKLTVTFAARTDVQVVIDGKVYQQQDNAIVLNNLRAGNHSIRIYKARRGNSTTAMVTAGLSFCILPMYKCGLLTMWM